MTAASLIVLGHAACAILLGWAYFRRFEMTRPPIGVLNLADIAIIVGGIILLPYLYLALPAPILVGVLAIGTASILYVVWEPVARRRWAIWLVVLGLAGADLGVALGAGATSLPATFVNNVVLTMIAVGVANLWAQGGMKARDAAVLGGALTVYDLVFTVQLPLMTDLFDRLVDLPFAPLIAWTGVDGSRVAIGLGDVLLATVFPPVMRKAFGRSAGLLALGSALLALAVLLLSDRGAEGKAFPAMVVLGPLMVLQYAYWSRRRGPERTTRQYLEAEPRGPKPAFAATRSDPMTA